VVRLKVNGKPVELEAPTPLVAYLRSLGVDPRAVAVEVNERIIERADFEQTTLQADDVVEIVRMVGGG
jgi:thiamine biosynthesis protein ThiS